jgi:hypothetical protein
LRGGIFHSWATPYLPENCILFKIAMIREKITRRQRSIREKFLKISKTRI